MKDSVRRRRASLAAGLTRVAVWWAAASVLLHSALADTVEIVNQSSRALGVGVYYSEKGSKSGNLLTRTSIAPGGSWSYAEPHRGDGRDALRGFGFETISGSRYAYAVVRWSHALPSDTVAVESISDANPNDRYVVRVDHEQSEDSLQVLVFRKE